MPGLDGRFYLKQTLAKKTSPRNHRLILVRNCSRRVRFFFIASVMLGKAAASG